MMLVGRKTERARAEALQVRTGWLFEECVRCVRGMPDESIEVLIKVRAREEKERKELIK